MQVKPSPITPDLRITLYVEAEGKTLQKCEQINDPCITVNEEFTLSANVLAAADHLPA